MPKPHPRANQSSHTRDRALRKRPARQAMPGQRAHTAGLQLLSYEVGALPLVTHIFDRMQLERILLTHLPEDDPRTELPTVRALLVLIANLLLSREPVYGVAEWAARFPPDLIGLRAKDLPLLHDDRFGRSLDRMFDGIGPALVMAVVRHVVQEFSVGLDELHNDSTTVSFYGAYEDAAEEAQQRGRPTHAITWGHSKARRPDLKQLLYILTITDDGNVPVHFSTASGNVVDDHTHIASWDLLHELVGHPNFLYVADCKLANSEDMSHIATRGGRFVTVLPRGRTEDLKFRASLHHSPTPVKWEELDKKIDDDGNVADVLSVCADEYVHSDGYRLFWYHSTRKAQLDVETRSRRITRAFAALGELRARLLSARTRFRERSKVEQSVETILTDNDVSDLVSVHVEEIEEATFRQATRGRPSEQTKYVKETRLRYMLTWKLNRDGLAQAEREDGVFPLVTNDRSLSTLEALRAYKRQPLIEKRFSQFKTDFAVAPVYLQNVARIQGLLAAYFFVLMAQTLLERELRQAMARIGLKSVPLYPENRKCARPTTHRVIEVFSTIQRHEVRVEGAEAQIMVTELTEPQEKIIRMLGLDPRTYGY